MATIKLPNSDQFDTMNGHLANIVSTATDAIGNRAYTEDNYVTDSETVTASIDALDIQVKDNTDAIAAMLSAVYPIGCVYTSVVSTSPATLFGMGTWVELGAGRVLVGIDAGQTEFDTVEETGGEKTSSALIAHTHPMTYTANASAFGAAKAQATMPSATGTEWNAMTGSTGSGSSFPILPPYIVVYRWKRTA